MGVDIERCSAFESVQTRIWRIDSGSVGAAPTPALSGERVRPGRSSAELSSRTRAAQPPGCHAPPGVSRSRGCRFLVLLPSFDRPAWILIFAWYAVAEIP